MTSSRANIFTIIHKLSSDYHLYICEERTNVYLKLRDNIILNFNECEITEFFQKWKFSKETRKIYGAMLMDYYSRPSNETIYLEEFSVDINADNNIIKPSMDY